MDEKAERMLRRELRLAKTANKRWERAARYALDGDTRELWLRVKMIDEGPMEIVQS